MAENDGATGAEDKMNRLIKQLSAEAHEILANIRDCDELTWQQKNDLMQLVDADVTMKLTLAKNLLHDWTGRDITTPPTMAE